MRFYGSFSKVDDEQRMVFGYASTEAQDRHGEIVLKSAVDAALADYLEYANLREMHQLSAVGTTEEASLDDKGLYIGAKVVDDTAWRKVTSGVYKGFSIGGKVLARDAKNKRIITKIRLDEISLVDRPSNPESKFDLWRAAGAPDTDVDDPIAKITAALKVADDKVAAIKAHTSKSINHVGRFAEFLDGLSYLAAAVQSEADLEADDSPVPAKLRKWLKAGAAIFADLAAEEVAEFVESFKVQKAAAITNALGAAVEEMRAGLPAPPKCAAAYGLRTIDKATDVAGAASLEKTAPSLEHTEQLLAAMHPDDRAFLLIKASLRMPQSMEPRQ